MLRFFSLISFLLIAINALAQDVFPEKEYRTEGVAFSIAELQAQLQSQLGLDIELIEDTLIQSQIGRHHRYHVSYGGEVIFGYDVLWNEFNNGKNLLRIPIIDDGIQATESTFPSKETLIKVAFEKIDPKSVVDSKTNWLSTNNKLLPGVLIDYFEDGELVQSLVGEDGHEYFYRTKTHHASKDSLVHATVFLPDPLTKARVSYGAPYADFDDSNSLVLNQLLDTVMISVRFDSVKALWKLESDYCLMRDISFPDTEVPSSATGDFLFGRGDDGFEAVNAFYHIQAYQAYLQELGFSNLVNYPLRVDANAQGGNDNSAFFESFGINSPWIELGTGGVDDAEDADVIVHEYGHAISFSCAPGTNLGAERQALDEGLGDYIAVSYSQSISYFDALNVFNWDGHNEFWNGRVANRTDTYPSSLVTNIYSDGELWASGLVELKRYIGREDLDRILFNSLYAYDAYMNMTEATQLLLEVDSQLFQGSHSQVIEKVMCARGFFPGCADTLLPDTVQIGVNILIDGPFISNSENFATEGEPLSIHSNGFVLRSLELYRLNGVLAHYQEIGQPKKNLELDLPYLENGIYILRIETTEGPMSYKILVARRN